MPPHKARTSSAVRHGHHGIHSRSSSATRLPGAVAAGNMNLQLTQKDPHPTGKIARTSSSQRVHSKEHLAAGLGMTQAQNHKQKPLAKNQSHAQLRAGVKQNAQQQQQAAAKGPRAGFAMAPSADGSDSSEEDEDDDDKGNDKGGEGDDDEEWVSTAESGAATPNHLESDSDTEAEVDTEPAKGSKLKDANGAKGNKNGPNPKGVLNAEQVDTQLLQQQNQQQQQRDSSREQKPRPDALKRNDTARAGDFVIAKPPPLVPVLQQMQQPVLPFTAHPARTPTNATGAPVQHARHRGEQQVPVLQAPPAVNKSTSEKERGRGVMERETSMDSTSTTTNGRSRPSSRATAAPQGRQLAPQSQGQVVPRPERPKRSRPPSTHSITKVDGQHLRPHPLIRGHSFNAAASGNPAPGLTMGGGAGPVGLMGPGGGALTPKPAPLAPLTVIPTSSEYPDVSADTPPPASGSSSMRGYFVSSSPASMKTMPTTSPSSDGVGGNSDKRRQSFSSQHSATTIPVHSTIIREPPAQPAQSGSGYSPFGYPRARTLSTMSTNSSSAALSALAQQLPSGVSSPHPSTHYSNPSNYHPHTQPHSSASSIYSSSSTYHGGHPSAHHPHSAHPSHPSTRPPSPLAPPQISFFPPVNPYANVEGIHPLLPNPYLCNHLTVLSRRAPIRESWERVMKARRGVGQV